MRILRLLAHCAIVFLVTSQSLPNIVSVSDLHGDFERGLQILESAGLIDTDSKSWIGGNSTLVQTGDIVDRGHESIKLYRLFARLAREATQDGGQVINLLGNHELMNIQGDFSYVSGKELQSMGGKGEWAALWEADGEIGRQVREFKTVAKVGPVLFVHAGLKPSFLEKGRTLEDIHRDMVAALADKGYPTGDHLERIVGKDGPLWTRFYTEDTGDVCNAAQKVLKQVGATRMVVGHTVQGRVNSICDGRVTLTDTGISNAYGGILSFSRYNVANEMATCYLGRSRTSKAKCRPERKRASR